MPAFKEEVNSPPPQKIACSFLLEGDVFGNVEVPKLTPDAAAGDSWSGLGCGSGLRYDFCQQTHTLASRVLLPPMCPGGCQFSLDEAQQMSPVSVQG